MNLAILIFINLIYAGAPTFLKVAVAEFSPETLVWLRHTIALMTLLPFAVVGAWTPMRWATLGRIAVATFLAFTLTSLLQVVGMRYSSASVGALVVAMQPLITIAMAALFLHEQLSTRLWMSCILALLGFAILSGENLMQLQGNLLFVLAIVCESSLGIFLRPLLKDHTPMQITVACLAFASLFLLPLQWDITPVFQNASAAAWGGVIYLGVGCSAIGTVLWLISLRTLQVSQSAVAWFLQPLWGSVLPVLVLGENISSNALWGGGLILIAMSVIFWQGRSRIVTPRATAPRAPAGLAPSH